MLRVLVLRPHAKINLMLRVGSARPDGFHDVRTLLQSVALSDRLTLTARRGPFALASSSPDVPSDRTNLVYLAAEALWRALGRTGDPRDADVRLVKRIPVAAGLGGGSADAAAALVGLHTLWSGRLLVSDLMRVGAELGSDVPFFFHGGTALGVNRGDELYPVDDIPRQTVVVIKPSFGVRAADAYGWLDADRRRALPGQPGVGAHMTALDVGWPGGPLALLNDLQAPVMARHPAIREMLDALNSSGARAAAMTGSGSAVFGVFSRPLSRAAVRRLQRPGWLVLVTRTSRRREAVRHLGL